MASTAETSFVAVAVGAVSSLAEGALPSAMLLRTGTTGVTATSRSDRDGEPVVMGHVPTIDDRIEGEERATALADRAISECMENLARSLRSRDPLVHGVRRAGLALTFGPVLVAAKSSSISSPVEQAAVSRITRGPVKLELGAGAAGPETEEESIGRLKQGFGWLRSGEADILFWGAAHTDWSTARLLELEKRGMLYHLLALDAVMPGEGSAFVAWMTEERAERAGLQPLLRFAGLGTAKVNLEDPVDRLGGFARALFDATRSSGRARSRLGAQRSLLRGKGSPGVGGLDRTGGQAGGEPVRARQSLSTDREPRLRRHPLLRRHHRRQLLCFVRSFSVCAGAGPRTGRAAWRALAGERVRALMEAPRVVDETEFKNQVNRIYAKDGSRLLVVVKATFALFQVNGAVEVAPRLFRRGVRMIDVHWGAPALTPIRYPSDWVADKPGCDVVFIGSAYAPKDNPTGSFEASFSVGDLKSRLRATGPRVYGDKGDAVSAPRPTLSVPIRWELRLGRRRSEPLRGRRRGSEEPRSAAAWCSTALP